MDVPTPFEGVIKDVPEKSGLQVSVAAPVAVNVADCPRQILSTEGWATTGGRASTLTFIHRSRVHPSELVTTRQYCPVFSGPVGEITGSQSEEVKLFGPVHAQVRPVAFELVKISCSPGQGVLALIWGTGGSEKT